jgi:integrase
MSGTESSAQCRRGAHECQTRPTCRGAGVDGVVVHTLRHSAATAWLEAGVHIKAVADLLGHSSIAVTGDLYGHVEDATSRAAIEGLSDSLGL